MELRHVGICILVLLVWECNGSTDVFRRNKCPEHLHTQPPYRINTTDRLIALRQRLVAMNLHAFIITKDDNHQSEYPAERDRRYEFISGFSGSDATAVVTRDAAALWTDGRYFIQADRQLSCDWMLMRMGQPHVPSLTDWLVAVLPDNASIGADPKLVSNSQWNKWLASLKEYNVTLKESFLNPIDRIWNATNGRPMYSDYEAYVLELKYAGKKWEDKIQDLRDEMNSLNADAVVITALDEVAWLLNIRGYEIPYNPLVHAYVIVSADMVNLYANETKLGLEVKTHLKTGNCFSEMCVRLHDYNAIIGDLKTNQQKWKRILLPSQCDISPGASRAIYSAVPEKKRLVKPSPIIFMKAKKNPIEAEGMRKSHIRDAVALCDFYAHFEESIAMGKHWDEVNVSLNVDQFRREQYLNKGPSFPTIAGFGPNGAAPHYVPTESQNVLTIDTSSTLVLDSGGQYLDGTTDVTRTIHLGTPTDFEREAYTRVLIGSIQLASLVFPRDSPMNSIDVLARSPLWEVGLNYLHGTGHGIGSFLVVHESPIKIAYSEGNLTFHERYFFSDEPGYYHEGKFGIRLENILEVVRKHPKHSPEGQWYGFRPVTYVPYDPKLIDIKLLSLEHRRWLNDYNAKIRTQVGAELKRQRRMKGFYWMMEKTTYIPEYGSSSSKIDINSHTIIFVVINIVIFQRIGF